MNRSSTSNKQPLSKWIKRDKLRKYVGSFNWCLVFQFFTVLLPIDIHIWSLKKWIRCVLYFPYWWTQSRWTVWGNIRLPWDQVQPCETLWTRKAFHKIWDFTESFPICFSRWWGVLLHWNQKNTNHVRCTFFTAGLPSRWGNNIIMLPGDEVGPSWRHLAHQFIESWYKCKNKSGQQNQWMRLMGYCYDEWSMVIIAEFSETSVPCTY